MSNEIEFEWNLYVGKHMKEPLNFKYIDESKREWDYKLAGVDHDSIHEKHEYFYFGYDLMIPQLKSLDSLTDEEWVYIALGESRFGGSVKVIKESMYIRVFDSGITMLHFHAGCINELKQNQWNRLHSLHRSENEKGLLEAGLIEIVE